MLCIQYPGETLYVPPTWAHFTMVLSDESYSFADSFSASVSGYLSQLW
jgi:oxalate decarboxylase/phosphoglucose isomerase-like protein (cupin superfamily)